jgi:glutamine amidotransferase
MIVIVDYGMGNLRSVEKAAQFLGKNVKVTESANLIKKAKKIIFPGVGHFGKAVKELKKRRIFKVLRGKIKDGIPFLGICLGMQLLLEESEEAKGLEGLAVIKGRVKKFKAKNLVIPHMGWNRVNFEFRISNFEFKKIFTDIKNNSYFYFAHSYYCQPKDKETVLASTGYGMEFASALHKDNIWGVQFHPEKSQELGLALFDNFLTLC